MQCVAVIFHLILLGLANSANVPIKGRIVGGQAVDISSYPHQVSVRIYDQHICGGSIIDANTVLTAAHCVHNFEPSARSMMTIRHGSSYANYGIQRRVVRVIENPEYNDNIMVNDAALLKIRPPIVFTRSSQPAPLARERLADNTSTIITGWGATIENGPAMIFGRQKLQSAIVKTINQDVCQELYPREVINQFVVCAAVKGRDSCQGDSGGALLDKKTRQIVGIGSYGIGCGRLGSPGVYASVPDLLKFIETNL